MTPIQIVELRSRMKCECGHQRIHHLSGGSECVWRDCSCKQFRPRPEQKGLFHMDVVSGTFGRTLCMVFTKPDFVTFDSHVVDCPDCLRIMNHRREAEG
jgi:hypothetical protein